MASDSEAINAVVEKFATSVTAGDPDEWIEIVTDDAIWLPPDLPIVSGKDTIKKWAIDDWYTPFDMDLSMALDELDIADSWASGRGHFTLKIAPKGGGDSMTLVGKYLGRYAKETDGSWKWSQFAFNWDAPMGS